MPHMPGEAVALDTTFDFLEQPGQAQAFVGKLNPDELALVEAVLQGNNAVLNNLLTAEYEEMPVSPAQFFTDPYYLGQTGADLYPKVLEGLIEVFSGSYTEIILGGAIGWGKTSFTEFGLLRMMYEVLCLRNPQKSLGLMEGSSIMLVNISVTEAQARKALFSGVLAKVRQSPFFKEVFPYDKNVTSELRFPKNVTLFPGASTDNSILGLNVIGGALDEGNFMPVREQRKMAGVRANADGVYDKAQTLYNAMLRRIKSRFLRDGKLPGRLFAISSAQYPDDFIERRVRDALTDPTVFVRSYSLWEIKPSAYSEQMFKVEVGTDLQGSRILTGAEDSEVIVGRVIEVPVDFLSDFERDIDGAIRDVAGISTLTVDQFIKDFASVAACVNPEKDPDRKHPYTTEVTTLMDGHKLYRRVYLKEEGGKAVLKHDKDAPRVAHIDPSLTMDATGIAVGHIVDMIKVVRKTGDGKDMVEWAPLIFYDLLLKVVPVKGREIPLDRIRDILYGLRDDGMNIRLVTMDRFQSAEALQHFRKKGIASDLLSVDKDAAPYEMLKQAFYERRVNMYQYTPALNELRRLEFDRSKNKIDHPEKGSKDISDAMAAVAFTLTTYARRLYKPKISTTVF